MRRTLLAIPILAALALLPAASAYGWSFAVCGDSRNDRHGILPKILAEVERSPMAFLIHTGDLEDGGGDRQWSAFRERTKGFTKPMRFAIGNHELSGGGTREGFVRASK